jgi:hypothetical protein
MMFARIQPALNLAGRVVRVINPLSPKSYVKLAAATLDGCCGGRWSEVARRFGAQYVEHLARGKMPA